MGRALEERFPTLYHHITEETPSGGGAAVVKRKAKTTEPALRDVIQAVLTAHRITDIAVAGDLASTLDEFLGLTKEPEEVTKKSKRAVD